MSRACAPPTRSEDDLLAQVKRMEGRGQQAHFVTVPCAGELNDLFRHEPGRRVCLVGQRKAVAENGKNGTHDGYGFGIEDPLSEKWRNRHPRLLSLKATLAVHQ